MTDTRKLYASVIRLLIQLIILMIVNWVITELPMIKVLSIEGLPVSLASIISMGIGIVAIVILLLFRREFVPGLRSKYTALPQAGIIVSQGITLLIIVIAYASSEGVIMPLMKQFAWLYPVIFLAVSIWPLYMLIATLYRSSGPLSEWAATRMSSSMTENLGEIKCPSCGKFSPASARYCTSCGASVGTMACDARCTACGATNRQQDKYCLGCGALLDKSDQYDTRVSV